VLVCPPCAANAPTATRREFLNALKAELPDALIHLQHGNIAPVDLAQAAIGPGMAVYTRYARVLDAEGKRLSVREALALINQTLDEVLAEQEGDFDSGSRWALAWFEQSGFAEGDYGVAETLSKAKNTSVSGMEESGILASRRGKVRLLRPSELSADWDPATDRRRNDWEVVHQPGTGRSSYGPAQGWVGLLCRARDAQLLPGPDRACDLILRRRRSPARRKADDRVGRGCPAQAHVGAVERGFSQDPRPC